MDTDEREALLAVLGGSIAWRWGGSLFRQPPRPQRNFSWCTPGASCASSLPPWQLETMIELVHGSIKIKLTKRQKKRKLSFRTFQFRVWHEEKSIDFKISSKEQKTRVCLLTVPRVCVECTPSNWQPAALLMAPLLCTPTKGETWGWSTCIGDACRANHGWCSVGIFLFVTWRSWLKMFEAGTGVQGRKRERWYLES